MTKEKMVYGPDSGNSWFADLIALSTKSVIEPRHQVATRRMLEWSDQVEREVASDSKLGRHALKQLREHYRETQGGEYEVRKILDDIERRGHVDREIKDGVPSYVESRAIATGGGATASASGGGGAAFVTPVFTEGNYVPYRQYGRAFANQCQSVPLPDYGMAIYKPIVTGPAGVAQFTENGSVTETDPSAGYIAATLVIFAGEITVSQTILDRTGPNFSFDTMCWDQLKRKYDPAFDTYVINQALGSATTQTWTGNSGAFDLIATSGSGGFYGQVSKAKAAMRTLAGTVLNPSSLFLIPSRWEYIAAYADANGRPLVVPDYAGPYNALGNSGDGDAGIEGATGMRFNGLPVFTDQNIPDLGTTSTDQALVSDLREVEVYEGDVVHRVLPQTLASNVEVILQQYSYATVLINYTAAVTAINGSGMSSISYTN